MRLPRWVFFFGTCYPGLRVSFRRSHQAAADHRNAGPVRFGTTQVVRLLMCVPTKRDSSVLTRSNLGYGLFRGNDLGLHKGLYRLARDAQRTVYARWVHFSGSRKMAAFYELGHSYPRNSQHRHNFGSGQFIVRHIHSIRRMFYLSRPQL